MALSTNHINKILWNNPYTKKYFIGTYPACRVEKLPKKKIYAFVTNTDHHSKSGAHWNSWFVRDETVYFFDSFSRSPMHESFPHDYKDIVLKFKKFAYFNVQVQSFDSFTCGFYVIHHILVFSLGLDFKDLSKEYGKNTQKNDLTVMNIIKSIV
jgi:hypothetical protein